MRAYKEYLYGKEIVGRIADDLRRRYSDAEYELFLYSRTNPRPESHRGTLDLLLPLFIDFCSEFRRVLVVYEPDHRYGMVCMTVCHCHGAQEMCDTPCTNFDERPHTILNLTKVGGRTIQLGASVMPHAG